MNSSNGLSNNDRLAIERKRLEALERRNRMNVVQNINNIKRPRLILSTESNMHTQSRIPILTKISKRPAFHLPDSKKASFPPLLATQKTTQLAGSLHSHGNTETTVTKSLATKLPPNWKAAGVKATCVLVDRNRFEVHAAYHAGLMLIFKSLPSRMFDPSTRKWRFNLTDYKEFLKQAGSLGDIQLEGLSSAVVSTFREKIDNTVPNLEEKIVENLDILEERLPKSLVDELMTFQKEGVSRAIRRNGRILLADDMGLGKTLQSLTIATAFQSDWPLLIVTPSSVRFAWREQIIRWLGGPLGITRADINVVQSVRSYTEADDYLKYSSDAEAKVVAGRQARITIFSYDLLSRCASKIGRMPPFGVVIMDESHFLKNFKTARCKAAMPIMKLAKRVILLTGTPALSRPMELFPQITAVQPSLFKGGFHEFGLRYCAAKENSWGWDYSGCSNMAELQIMLEETLMIRRVKSEVLGQLPPKIREVVILDPGLINKIKGSKNSLSMDLCTLTDLKALERHGELLRFFNETSRVKLPAVEQYIADLLESDRKFILFAHHQNMLNSIGCLLDAKSVEYIRIDGKTPAEQRHVVCDRFQTDERCKVALLSITAANTGLHLTAASLVVFAELFWNPGVLVQAEDRAYRIGQEDSVNVRYLLAEGTADDCLWALVKSKLDVLTKAGLNRESFEGVNLKRMPHANTTATLDDFFTEEKPTADDFEVPADMLADFEKHDALERTRFEDRVSRRLSPLFSQMGPRKSTDTSSTLALVTFVETESSRKNSEVLVAASPEGNDNLEDLFEGEFNVDEVISSKETPPNATNDLFGDEDSVLQSAAMAAETEWLTEALMMGGDSPAGFR